MASENSLPPAPRSRRVPFIPGEGSAERHKRRLSAALEDRSFEDFLSVYSATVERNNNNHHWVIRFGRLIFEWWPSSGRFVINKKYAKPLKFHDVEQVKIRLTREFSKYGRAPK